jgi:hypothetical protein
LTQDVRRAHSALLIEQELTQVNQVDLLRHLKKNVLFIAQMSVLAVVLFNGLFQAWHHMPKSLAFNCDAYGYLKQAQTFRDRGLLRGMDTSLVTSESTALIDILKGASGVKTVTDWEQVIAPNCHHYIQKSDKVVNQYPPGTGLVMSFFKAGRDSRSLYMTATTAIIIGFGLAFSMSNLSLVKQPIPLTLAKAAIGLIAMQFLVQKTLWGDGISSYSIAATLGFLSIVALAMFLAFDADGKPLPFVFLFLGSICGLLIIIRLPSIFIATGVGLYLFTFTVLKKNEITKSALCLTMFCLSFFLFGLLPLGFANHLNAGSVLSTTYSGYDAGPMRLTVLKSGLIFYGSNGYGGQAALVATTAVVYAVIQAVRNTEDRPRRIAVAVAVGFIFVTSLLFHASRDPQVTYYFVPASLFVITVVVFYSLEVSWRSTQPQLTALRISIASTVILVVSLLKLGASPIDRYDTELPNEVRRSNAIVWATDTSGTLEFHSNKYAAKIHFGQECIQNEIIARVFEKGMPQYFVADSEYIKPVMERMAKYGTLTKVGDYKVPSVFPIVRLDSLDLARLPRC